MAILIVLALPKYPAFPCAIVHRQISQRILHQISLSMKNLRRKFSKFVPNHIFGDRYIMINDAVVNLEFKAHEIW